MRGWNEGNSFVNSTLDARTRWLALMVLCLGTLMIVLDTTIVTVALPSIRADLQFSEAAMLVGARFAAVAAVLSAWLVRYSAKATEPLSNAQT